VKIGILGAGAWGSALACVAARSAHETVLWGRDTYTMQEIATTHMNQHYLGDLTLETKINATDSIERGVLDSDYLLLAVPTQQLSGFLASLPALKSGTILVGCAKGMEQGTNRLPAQIIACAFPGRPLAALSGPGFAQDVVRGLPTAVTLASNDPRVADTVAKELSSDNFRCYSSTDLIGVELGGALKNIMAIAVGIAHGMELGASAKAALITRGFAELTRLASALGANRETMSGLSGMGDLVLTCSSPQSRNFAYGAAIGKGLTRANMKLAEGAFTASAALGLAKENDIDVPIIEMVAALLDGTLKPEEALIRLLTRPLKREN